MNILEVLGILLIIETIIEAYLIYRYRFIIRQLFHIVTTPVQCFIPEQVTYSKPYRDARGRFAKQPA